jgi:hypothetical protein
MAKPNEATTKPETDGPERALVGAGAEFTRRRPVPLNPDAPQAKGQWDKLDWFPERIVESEEVAAEVMDRAVGLGKQHAGPRRGWELAQARKELQRQLELMDEQERKWRVESGRKE